MKQKRKNVLLVGTVLVMLILVLGATFAYFVAQGGATSNSAVRVQTSTPDNLSFSMGSSLNLTADQTSFASGKGNVTGSTTKRQYSQRIMPQIKQLQIIIFTLI